MHSLPSLSLSLFPAAAWQRRRRYATSDAIQHHHSSGHECHSCSSNCLVHAWSLCSAAAAAGSTKLGSSGAATSQFPNAKQSALVAHEQSHHKPAEGAWRQCATTTAATATAAPTTNAQLVATHCWWCQACTTTLGGDNASTGAIFVWRCTACQAFGGGECDEGKVKRIEVSAGYWKEYSYYKESVFCF